MTEYLEEPVGRVLKELDQRQDMSSEEVEHLQKHLPFLIRDKHRRTLASARPPVGGRRIKRRGQSA